MKKKILIILGMIAVVGGLLWFGLSYWIGGSIGGGGMQQYAPDTVQAGELADITIIATATGGGGNIQGRFTNLTLHYRLLGENAYKSIQSQSIALPDNFKTVQSKTFQSEAYKFTIPTYPKGITGEIEYYVEMTFDGYPSKTDGVKKIKVVDSTPLTRASQESRGEPQSTAELKANKYSVGQYLDWVGKVSEYVQDCGGGESCLSYLRISLPENMRTNDIFEARINTGECVDKTLRSNEIVRVMGNIQNVIPDIGLVFSCANSGTSVTREVRSLSDARLNTFLERVRAQYQDVFSEPTNFSFEWRSRDSNMGINTPPIISNIQGKKISASEFSFQDLIHGEQSLLFQIEKTLPVFFEQEGFIQALENDADHPTNGSSVQGYKRIKDGIVCLRVIEDTESEFINYQIACGFF